MKALFITKPFVIEPLGLMYLSAAAKKAGHNTLLALTSENLEEIVSNFHPDMIGYSIMTGDQGFYEELTKRLKRQFHDIFFIAGGPHPTFFPEFLEHSNLDAICRGEGEGAVTELLDTLENRQVASNIRNLWIKTEKGIIQNPVRQLADVDTLPFPDRDLVFRFPEIRKGPIKHFLASRGCPFSCSYCFNKPYFELYKGKGKKVRFRSPDSVVEEIRQVVNSSPAKFVYFQDDTFTLDRQWLKQFAEKYSKEINLPFHCHVRPNTLDGEIAGVLRKAGCYSVHIAAETADDNLRNNVLKRGMTKEQILEASKLLRQAGIKFMLQNIIGIPSGSLEKDFETLEMNIQCKPDYSWVSIYQPYPKTALGDFSRKQGFYSGDFSDINPSFFDSSPLNFPEEYKNQLANLQKLFAIFVEHPSLHELGLSRVMTNAERTPEVQKAYKRAYAEFRKKGDERLYGFKL